jgi:hypothetical protein
MGSALEDDIYIQGDDTLIVRGNLFQSVNKYTGLIGPMGCVSFLFRGGN